MDAWGGVNHGKVGLASTVPQGLKANRTFK